MSGVDPQPAEDVITGRQETLKVAVERLRLLQFFDQPDGAAEIGRCFVPPVDAVFGHRQPVERTGKLGLDACVRRILARAARSIRRTSGTRRLPRAARCRATEAGPPTGARQGDAEGRICRLLPYALVGIHRDLPLP